MHKMALVLRVLVVTAAMFALSAGSLRAEEKKFSVTGSLDTVWPAALLSISEMHMKVTTTDKSSGLIVAEQQSLQMTIIMAEKDGNVDIAASSTSQNALTLRIGSFTGAFKKKLLKRLGQDVKKDDQRDSKDSHSDSNGTSQK
jgi:hypothetical protein